MFTHKVVKILHMNDRILEKQLDDYAKDGWELLVMLPVEDHQFMIVMRKQVPPKIAKRQHVKYRNVKVESDV